MCMYTADRSSDAASVMLMIGSLRFFFGRDLGVIGGMSGGEHLAAGGHALEVSLLAARFSQQLLVQSILQYQLETRQE